MQKRVADNAAEYQLAIPLFHQFAGLYEHDDAQVAAAAHSTAATTARFVQAMFDAAHGGSKAGLPSQSDLGEILHLANVAAAQLFVSDTRFMDRYMGTLSDHHARVVRSMVVAGGAILRRE